MTDMTLTLRKDFVCSALHGESGAELNAAAAKEHGGPGDRFSPTDLLAVSLGTCVMTVLAIVAKRKGLDITGSTARVEKEMTTTPPHRVGSIKMTVTLPGEKRLPVEQRAGLERSAQLCPVKQSLHPAITITMDFLYEE